MAGFPSPSPSSSRHHVGAVPIVANDTEDLDNLGTSVDIHPNGTIVAGAPNVNFDVSVNVTLSNTGAIYVFDRTGQTTWVQVQKLEVAVPIAGEILGFSVAIDGDTIVGGAPLASGGAGRAPVFEFDGATWLEKQILTACVAGEGCGDSVDVEGDRIVIGAPRHDIFLLVSDIAEAGAVFSFDRIGGTWTLGQTIESQSPYRFQNCGSAVSIRNDTLVVGCPEIIASGSFLLTGLANVYETSLIDGSTWNFAGRMHRGTELLRSTPRDFFGVSVATWEGIAVAGAFNAEADLNTVQHGNAFLAECISIPSCPALP